MNKLNIEYVAVEQLIPYTNNPRRNDKAVDVVAESIKEFGFKNPIIVDENNTIIAGHTRLLAAKKLGIKEVPIIKVEDLTEQQVKAFRIADNKTTEFAEWDIEMLAAELEDLEDIFTGFDANELTDLFGDKQEIVEDDFDVDGEANKIEEPVSKQGDVWLLGRHRLMCGDATVIADVEKLMGGKQADMVFTDPPYNVDYQGGTKEKLKILNDKMSDSNFYQFLYDAYVSMFISTKPGGAIYVCHAESEGLNFRKAMIDSGWMIKQCIIWAKNSLVMGRQDYQWKHEPILYGWKPGASHTWFGGRKKTTVWEDVANVTVRKEDGHSIITFTNGINAVSIKVDNIEVLYDGDDAGTTLWRFEKPLKNKDHPTMKPIGIPARAINNSCILGGVVLDLFCGSGSTLIAAEQTGRKCYAMELDPVYCDVIVKRYINFKGHGGDVYLERDGNKIAFSNVT